MLGWKYIIAILYIRFNYGTTTRKLRNDYGPTTHELRKDYGRITDGNYGVLYHFYDYVYGILRRTTLTFFGPYCMYTLLISATSL